MATKLQWRIVEHLSVHIDQPQSIIDLMVTISGHSPERVLHACMLLRLQDKVGRRGTGLPGDPFQFFLNLEERAGQDVLDGGA